MLNLKPTCPRRNGSWLSLVLSDKGRVWKVDWTDRKHVNSVRSVLILSTSCFAKFFFEKSWFLQKCTNYIFASFLFLYLFALLFHFVTNFFEWSYIDRLIARFLITPSFSVTSVPQIIDITSLWRGLIFWRETLLATILMTNVGKFLRQAFFNTKLSVNHRLLSTSTFPAHNSLFQQEIK